MHCSNYCNTTTIVLVSLLSYQTAAVYPRKSVISRTAAVYPKKFEKKRHHQRDSFIDCLQWLDCQCAIESENTINVNGKKIRIISLQDSACVLPSRHNDNIKLNH